jgi:hypothetical protein
MIIMAYLQNCSSLFFFVLERETGGEEKIENVCKVNYFDKTCKHVNSTRTHNFQSERALFFPVEWKSSGECKLEWSSAQRADLCDCTFHFVKLA